MAVCKLCEKEMLEGSSCLPSKLRWIPKRGRVVDYERIRNGEEKRYGAVEPDRCHDCSVMPGGYHHPGCDVEECPRCGGQLISCFCHGSGRFVDLVPATANPHLLSTKAARTAPPMSKRAIEAVFQLENGGKPTQVEYQAAVEAGYIDITPAGIKALRDYQNGICENWRLG